MRVNKSTYPFGSTPKNLSGKLAASADRRFEFDKRSQLLIRTHEETLSVAAMRVTNPDCTPATKPTGAAALLIVQDCFRCRFAHFNLGADPLDLGRLLFNLGRENVHRSLLLRDS